MIDVENEIFTALASILRKKYPGIFVTGIPVNAPSKFPAVFISESDNYEPKTLSDGSDTEKYAEITYEIEVYSNDLTEKKSICKKISADIDVWMREHNFRRHLRKPMPNRDDPSIYRMYSMYRAVTDGKTIYRR